MKRTQECVRTRACAEEGLDPRVTEQVTLVLDHGEYIINVPGTLGQVTCRTEGVAQAWAGKREAPLGHSRWNVRHVERNAGREAAPVDERLVVFSILQLPIKCWRITMGRCVFVLLEVHF